MRNRNITEAKKSSCDSKLAEIEKQGKLVTMEAKIEALGEMIEAKNQRLTLVNEDENLSELIDKKKVKEMQREIKLLEKQKGKLEKMYEKAGGTLENKEVVSGDTVDAEVEEGNVGEELLTPNEEAGEAVEDESASGAFEESVNEGKDKFYHINLSKKQFDTMIKSLNFKSIDDKTYQLGTEKNGVELFKNPSKNIYKLMGQGPMADSIVKKYQVEESVNEDVYGSVGFIPRDKNPKSEHPNWDDLTAGEIQDYIDSNPSTLWGRSLSTAKMVRDQKQESVNEEFNRFKKLAGL